MFTIMTKSCTLFMWGIVAAVTYTALSAGEDAFEFFEENKKSFHAFVMELLSKLFFGIILVILLYFMRHISKDSSHVLTVPI